VRGINPRAAAGLLRFLEFGRHRMGEGIWGLATLRAERGLRVLECPTAGEIVATTLLPTQAGTGRNLASELLLEIAASLSLCLA
jgi:hypothetical protein